MLNLTFKREIQDPDFKNMVWQKGRDSCSVTKSEQNMNIWLQILHMGLGYRSRKPLDFNKF